MVDKRKWTLECVKIIDRSAFKGVVYVSNARVESHHFASDLDRIMVQVNGNQYTLLAETVREFLGLGNLVTGFFVLYDGGQKDSSTQFKSLGKIADFCPWPSD